MSNTFADDFVVPWIEKYKWPQTKTQDGLLVLSVPIAASPDGGIVHWNSAVGGVMEVQTKWDVETERLIDTSVSVEVPGFGQAVLFSGKSIDMKDHREISVALPNAGVVGSVKFVHTTTKDMPESIGVLWDFTAPWMDGSQNDCRGLFPRQSRSSPFLTGKLQNIGVITDLEVSALKKAPLSDFKVVTNSSGRELTRFDTISAQDEAQQAVVASFIHDNVAAGDTIVTVPALSGPKSEGNTIDVSFLGIFQLVGTILPAKMAISAALYVKIPFLPRVKIIELKGSLLAGVEGNVNLVLAKGSIKMSARPNSAGKHDLYIDHILLDVKFVGKIDYKDIKLFTLPF